MRTPCGLRNLDTTTRTLTYAGTFHADHYVCREVLVKLPSHRALAALFSLAPSVPPSRCPSSTCLCEVGVSMETCISLPPRFLLSRALGYA